MVQKITEFADYFRKIPAAFLVAIVSVLALILFLPEEYARAMAVDNFRSEYRVFLGPVFLLAISFCVARVFIFFMEGCFERKALREMRESLHHLTPEEKGYLIPYIEGQQNSVHVGVDDGVMASLRAKGITYRASNMGDVLNGFAFNLRPWARQYLEKHPHILEGYTGQPLTPQQKRRSQWWS